MRTVIVEDSAPAAAALREALEQLSSIEVIGTATTQDEAVQVVLSLLPDLVLLDLGLASGSGYGVMRRVRAAGNGARVVVVSNRTGEAHREACLAAGADDFFDNSGAPDALLQRIVDWLPPEPIDEVRRLKALHALEVLSVQELRVALLLAQGRSVADIATTVHLSVKTVSTYRTRALEKLHLASNADLTRYCLAHGLIEL